MTQTASKPQPKVSLAADNVLNGVSLDNLKANLSVKDQKFLVIAFDKDGNVIRMKDRYGQEMALDYSDNTKWYAVEKAHSFEQNPLVHVVLIFEWIDKLGRYTLSVGAGTGQAHEDLRTRHPDKQGRSIVPGVSEMDAIKKQAGEMVALLKKGGDISSSVSQLAKAYYAAMDALGVKRETQLEFIRQYSVALKPQPRTQPQPQPQSQPQQ